MPEEATILPPAASLRGPNGVSLACRAHTGLCGLLAGSRHRTPTHAAAACVRRSLLQWTGSRQIWCGRDTGLTARTPHLSRPHPRWTYRARSRAHSLSDRGQRACRKVWHSLAVRTGRLRPPPVLSLPDTCAPVHRGPETMHGELAKSRHQPPLPGKPDHRIVSL